MIVLSQLCYGISLGAFQFKDWYDPKKTNVLVAVILFSFLILLFIYLARKGKKLFVRKIAGLEAVDEAVGRATEMGKPILYVPGLAGVSDVATLAAINILNKIAEKTAVYETRLIVPCNEPLVMTLVQEGVKNTYFQMGRPDAFRKEDIFFITESQFGYTAAVDGLMVRERPATNFYMGAFAAESLLLAETGNSTGAIQIAGTDSIAQLPFFIVACDYTLIGEELYAASAYLSREPLFLGSLKGQDYSKLILTIFIIAGMLCATLYATFDWKPFKEFINLFSIK